MSKTKINQEYIYCIKCSYCSQSRFLNIHSFRAHVTKFHHDILENKNHDVKKIQTKPRQNTAKKNQDIECKKYNDEMINNIKSTDIVNIKCPICHITTKDVYSFQSHISKELKTNKNEIYKISKKCGHDLPDDAKLDANNFRKMSLKIALNYGTINNDEVIDKTTLTNDSLVNILNKKKYEYETNKHKTVITSEEFKNITYELSLKNSIIVSDKIITNETIDLIDDQIYEKLGKIDLSKIKLYAERLAKHETNINKLIKQIEDDKERNFIIDKTMDDDVLRMMANSKKQIKIKETKEEIDRIIHHFSINNAIIILYDTLKGEISNFINNNIYDIVFEIYKNCSDPKTLYERIKQHHRKVVKLLNNNKNVQ